MHDIRVMNPKASPATLKSMFVQGNQKNLNYIGIARIVKRKTIWVKNTKGAFHLFHRFRGDGGGGPRSENDQVLIYFSGHGRAYGESGKVGQKIPGDRGGISPGRFHPGWPDHGRGASSLSQRSPEKNLGSEPMFFNFTENSGQSVFIPRGFETRPMYHQREITLKVGMGVAKAHVALKPNFGGSR